MSKRQRYVVAAVVSIVSVGMLWACWIEFRPRPDLSRAIALAEAKRFDEADVIIRAYLVQEPGSTKARMLAAQLALYRPAPPVPEGELPDPKPALLALDHLQRITPDDPYLASYVELYRGKAEFRLGRFDAAELAWHAALRHDPRIPEAGWHLLDLFYLQGRTADSRRLALELHAVEPDPRDRVKYLLELLRQDARPPAPESIAKMFRPIVEHHPDDIHARLAEGVAVARSGAIEEGLRILKPVLENSPESPEGWEAWLTILDEAGEIDQLSSGVDRLPKTLAGSPRFARYRARLAQERGDWKSAAQDYRLALRAAPFDHRIQYRLIRCLLNSGATAEAEPLERGYRAYLKAKDEAGPLYDEANGIKTLGLRAHPGLYQRIADLRERMGLPDEALAWHRLVLRDDPLNRTSLAKVDQLSRSPENPSSEGRTKQEHSS